MTSHSRPDRDRPGNRDLTFALLAARLSELSEQAGRLASRLDAAEAAIGAQAGILAEAADLAQEVTRLSAAIAGHGAAPAARYVPTHPRQPVWAAMNVTERRRAPRPGPLGHRDPAPPLPGNGPGPAAAGILLRDV